MVARPIWTGTISFGLVQIPVNLFSVEKRDDMSLSLLDKRDKSPIRYERLNARTNKPVEWSNIVKGYEYEKEQYVIVTPDDIRAAAEKASQTVEITTFIDVDEVSPVYYETPYYVQPVQGKNAKQTNKAYALLRTALRETEKVGLAKVVIRTREHMALVQSEGPILMLYLLRYAHEIRSLEDIDAPLDEIESVEIRQAELKTAIQLVNGMEGHFTPQEYRDTYRDAFIEYIEKKIKTGKSAKLKSAQRSQQPAGNVVDLVALLKKSVKQHSTSAARVSRKKTTKSKSPRAA